MTSPISDQPPTKNKKNGLSGHSQIKPERPPCVVEKKIKIVTIHARALAGDC